MVFSNKKRFAALFLGGLLSFGVDYFFGQSSSVKITSIFLLFGSSLFFWFSYIRVYNKIPNYLSIAKLESMGFSNGVMINTRVYNHYIKKLTIDNTILDKTYLKIEDDFDYNDYVDVDKVDKHKTFLSLGDVEKMVDNNNKILMMYG